MISVIVITYNQKNYIKECLDSILLQDVCEDIEVLVGDDCSTDGTTQIVLEYASLHPDVIKPIIRNNNIGATANIVDLINRAKGRYVCFCEGDDYWISSSKLRLQSEFLDNYNMFSSVVHKTIIVDKDHKLIDSGNLNWIRHKRVYELKDFDALQLPGHISSLFVKNSSLFKNSSISSMLCDRNSSDKEIFLLTLAIGKIGLIDEYLSAYRFLRNSDSGSLVASIYFSPISRSVSEMQMLVAMEKWMSSELSIKKYFIKAQTKWLITAVFHKIKGFNVKLSDVWCLCNHKILCLLYLPYMLMVQLISKGRIVLKKDIR